MPKTRSKKDVPRLTVAFYDDNMEFCKAIAQREHLSVTQLINRLISQEKAKHDPETWKTPEGGIASA